MKSDQAPSSPRVPEHYTTLEVASMLGLAVRSVQLMVDRNELEAWKTPGGHRRISRASVERWIQTRAHGGRGDGTGGADGQTQGRNAVGAQGPKTQQILLIEDSVHFQNLVSLLVKKHSPDVALHIANDGITGLAMYGQIQPDVLIVDILLPGIDGATLITALRSQPQFANSHLIVVTSLDAKQREPYSFALQGVAVIHKPQLVAELPAALARCLATEKAIVSATAA